MIEYILQRKKRKTLSIRIQADGQVVVSVPLFTSKSDVDNFVNNHLGWIEKQRKRLYLERTNDDFGLSEGEFVPLFGKKLKVRIWARSNARFTDEEVYLPQNGKKALLRAYAAAMKEYLPAVLERYQREMGVVAERFTITSAKTRWGSCSAKNALCFSAYLAMCERYAVDYVVVHELAHIRNKNHSKTFWAEVEKYCPNYREAKKYLKNKYYYTHFL